MGFLGVRRKDRQNGPMPVSSIPSLRHYLETDPEMQEKLAGHSMDDLIAVPGPNYKFFVPTYWIEDDVQRIVEVGKVREDEYRPVIRKEN